jgi:hypothetical protein
VPIEVVRGARRRVDAAEQPPGPAPSADPQPVTIVGRALDFEHPFVMTDGVLLHQIDEALSFIVDLLDPERVAKNDEAQTEATKHRNHVAGLRRALQLSMANNPVQLRRLPLPNPMGGASVEGMTPQ